MHQSLQMAGSETEISGVLPWVAICKEAACVFVAARRLCAYGCLIVSPAAFLSIGSSWVSHFLFRLR
jgi:hypothetical protein